MNTDSINREFNVRYYYWAMEDFKREIEQGFPHLKQFKTGSPYAVMEMMSNMTLDMQRIFASGLVKRFHKEAVKAVGDNFKAEEKELCEQYRTSARGLTPAELDTRNRLLAGGPKLHPNRRLMTNLVKGEMKQLNLTRWGEVGRDLIYNLRVGEWNILTHVETKHAHAQLIYCHRIHSVHEETIVSRSGEIIKLPISIRKNISFNSWLGVNSETGWFDLVEPEFHKAAEQLARLCRHFFEVVPRLLKGLETAGN